VLSSNLETPLVSETSVGSDLEESLNVFSELGLEDVGGHLEVLTLFVVTLSVKEPSGDTVTLWLSNDFSDGVGLFFAEFTSSEFGVDSEDFADVEGPPSSDSLDSINGVWDAPLAVNVGVKDTMNVLEVVLRVLDDQRHAMDNIKLIFYSKY
jgi:hypothetical protein